MEMDRKEIHYCELVSFLYGLANSGTNKLEFLNTFFQTKCILIELSKVKKKKNVCVCNTPRIVFYCLHLVN